MASAQIPNNVGFDVRPPKLLSNDFPSQIESFMADFVVYLPKNIQLTFLGITS